MTDDITPQQIKAIRTRYGLSQQAFARVLGIGPASIARYEKGARPTKANANLIRAAEIPEFMAGCLEREGDQLTARQRESVEKIVYAEMTFDEEGEVVDINDIYEITLQQEVLNEKAWDIIAQVSRARREAEREGDLGLAMIYEDIELQVARLVPHILSEESASWKELDVLGGQLLSFQKLMTMRSAKAA